jgi:hypothetical protein
MPDASYSQTSFLGGEWSPYYQGRTDHPRYKTAMNVCLNGYPIEEGAWLRRTGTKFKATTRNGTEGKLLAFAYNETLPFDLEFTDGHLRIFNGDDLVLETPVGVITSISTANPALLTMGTAQSWSTGDQIEILVTGAGTAPALAGLVNRQFTVTKVTTTTFTLADPVDGSGLDGAVDGNVWDGTTAATAARIVDFATPYTATGIWYTNRIAQFNQFAIIFNQGYPTQVLQITNVTASLARFATFTFGPIAFQDGPYFPAVTNQTIALTGTSGTITGVFTGGFGPAQASIVAADVGRLIRLFSEPPLWAVGTSYVAGNVVAYGGLYWNAQKSSTGVQPDTDPTAWMVNPTAAAWVWGIIASCVSTTSATITLQNGPLLYSNDIRSWRLGLVAGPSTIAGPRNYPNCGCVHEGRVWMSLAQTIFSSQPDDPFNFTPTLSDGTVTDAGAINYTLEAGSEDDNTIHFMSSDQTGIIAGSFAGEWLVQASTLSDPLTPTSIQAKRVTKYGSANIEPVRTGLALVFVQKYQRRVMEMIADVFTGRYRAPDLAVTSRHLTSAQVEELAYQEELTPIVWMRTRSGLICGVTYRRISAYAGEEPTFVGWHRHQLGSGRGAVSLIMSAIPIPVGS